MARPQVFERDLKLAGAGIDPAVLQRRLAELAKEALAEAQSSGDAPGAYVRAVNGRIGAAEDSVILPGPIVYTFNWLPEVATYALEFAEERSPVLSGRFKHSWFVMVDGQATEDFEDIPLEAELILTNDQPYARKIEVGHMHMSVPPGIVEDTRQAVLRRFGNIITAQKRFIPLEGGYVLKRAGKGRRKARTARALSYPALVVNSRF